MIFIFGLHNDRSTIDVLNWIRKLEITSVLITDLKELQQHFCTIKNKKIKSIWYRQHNEIRFENFCITKNERSFLYFEYEYYLNFIQSSLKNIRTLGGGFDKMNLNKYQTLNEANNIGLLTPSTIITTCKKELKEFHYTFKKIITKPIFNGISIDLNNEYLGIMYTSIVEEELINSLPTTFFPSLFQEYIEKEIELRIFI